MSDCDLRQILDDVMADLDAGRLRPHRTRRAALTWLGGPVLAASLGLGLAGCHDRAVGVTHDAGADAYVDPGPYEDYGVPPVEVDAALPGPDGGVVGAYGVPPTIDPDAAVAADAEPPGDGLYAVPFFDLDLDTPADPADPEDPESDDLP